MSETMSKTHDRPTDEQPHTLQCMEIVGGNRAVHDRLSSPGLDIWLDSRPVEGQSGGDVHYFSMCGSGRVTRLAVADVSGHGPTVDGIAGSLRRLMRKHINKLDQTRFARAVNAEFTAQADSDYFATVILITYFAPTDHLLVCNGGHPQPLWYQAREGRWRYLHAEVAGAGPPIQEERGTYAMRPLSNLPFGVIEPTEYLQFSVKLNPDDLVIVYTDALVEAKDADGEPLGEERLLEMVNRLDVPRPDSLVNEVIDAVSDYRGGVAPDDDQTIILLHHNATDPPRITLSQAAKSMVRMLGLSKV